MCMPKNMEYIYYCKMLNQNKPEEMYEQIFQGRLDQQISVFQRFEEKNSRIEWKYLKK